MIVAKIKVDGVSAKTAYLADIPAGIIGARVEIEYADAMWSGLSKTVVFSGCCTKDVTNAGTSVIVPAEVVAKPGARIMVGVYGVDDKNNIAVPTLWAPLGVTLRAADPSGDAATDPALPVWAQLDSRVTALEENPVDEKQVEAIVQEYLAENPVESGATAEEAAQIARNKEDVGNLKKDKLDASELPTAINEALAQAKASGEFDGADGEDGYTPVKGKDYFDGQPGADGKDGNPGADGTSATHSWNGTVLTITSASGTSSADLKGEPGKDGETPVRGTDYWTEADKAEIKAYVDEAILGGAW